MSVPCPTCGATDQNGFLCGYCGTPTRALRSADDEAHALDEFHAALVQAPSDKRARVLENGYLPSHPRVLVDAGLRMLPTLENAAGQSEAAGRLQAIVSKLRLVPDGDDSATKAAAELDHHLQRYYRSDRVTGYWVIAILAAMIGGGIYYFNG